MSRHGLSFYIEGAEISVDDMAEMVTGIMRFDSEHMQEEFAHDATHAIMEGVAKEAMRVKAQAYHAKLRKEWVKLHPPNFAGYYYCHIGGEWVHIEAADLEHIDPESVTGRIDMDEPGWDEKLRMACRPHNSWKGSRQDVPSATLEYAPPDEAC